MPNLNAGKKALRSDARKRVYNLRRSRTMKETVKEVLVMIKDGKNSEAQAALQSAYKAIDKAAKRGIIKKNTASRKKSRLAKQVKSASTK